MIYQEQDSKFCYLENEEEITVCWLYLKFLNNEEFIFKQENGVEEIIPPTIEISDLHTSKEYRNKGYAKQLLFSILEIYSNEYNLVLSLENNKNKKWLEKFYKSLGFIIPIKHIHCIYDNGNKCLIKYKNIKK